MMHTESHIRSAFSMTCVLKMTVLPRALSSTTGVLERLGIDRVETAERLVENDQLRIVKQRGDELDLLLHAARQLVHLRQTPVAVTAGQREALEPFVDSFRRFPDADAFQLGEEHENATDLHLLVQTPLLREIAEAVAHRNVELDLPNNVIVP